MFSLFKNFYKNKTNPLSVNGNAATTQSAEEKLAKERKLISDFIKHLTRTDNDGQSEEFDVNYFYTPNNEKIKDKLLLSTQPDVLSDKLSFIVFGMEFFKSLGLFDSIMPYIKLGHRFVIILDSSSITDDVNFAEKIAKIEAFPNVLVVRTKKECSNFIRFRIGLELCHSVYAVCLSLCDIINPRSFVTSITDIIRKNPDRLCFLPKMLESSGPHNCWSVSNLSGCVFNVKHLQEKIDKRQSNRFWLLKNIISVYDDNDIIYYDTFFTFNHYAPKEISSFNIASMVNEAVAEIKKDDFSVSTVNKVLSRLSKAVSEIYTSCKLKKMQKFLLCYAVLYSLYLCEKKGIDTEEWKEVFSKIFDFGTLLKSKDIQRLFGTFIDILLPDTDSDLFIVENYGISDIRNSKFFDLVCEKFKVDYLLKRSNFDYYDFNNMLIKMHSKVSVLTIASGSLNKNMLNENDNHLTLWHGLGWMKKTVVKPHKFTVGDIVCSSEYCAPRYKKHFFADNAIPLGSIQTDKLFDDDFRNKYRNEIRNKYGIPSDARVIFFAPTFRIGKNHPYYNFGIDIEKLSEEFAKNNVYLITKKHHVFSSIMQDRGIDASGVYNSKNGHFIVDTIFDFNQLICSCDSFATDYSSGMYYAFAINQPVFLYATDVKEYTKGPNGFEINYPHDVPVPFVGEPSISKFMQAFEDSFKFVNTKGYQAYKKDNVGACDGHVAEKLISYILEHYFSK